MVAPITSWLWWVGDGPHGPGLSPRWHGRGTSAPPWALLVRRHANVLSRVVGHERRITHLPARRGRGKKPLGTERAGVLQRDLSEGTFSWSSSILRCVRALTRVCSPLLIAACRWLIMTSVQAVPVHTLGYRPCPLFCPMYWESTSNAPQRQETAVAPARAGVIPREEVSRARALAPPAAPGTSACLRHRHPRRTYRSASRRRVGRGGAAPDGPGRHPGDPA